VLDAFQESGLSMAAFAAETGIGAWRLRGWQRKLGLGQDGGDSVRFLPVRVRGAAPAPQMAGAALEDTTQSGFHVRTEGGFAIEDLVRLIGRLERLGCSPKRSRSPPTARQRLWLMILSRQCHSNPEDPWSTKPRWRPRRT